MSRDKRLCVLHTGKALPQFLLGKGPQEAGGAEVQLTLLLQALRSHDWSVDLVMYQYGNEALGEGNDSLRLIPIRERRGGLPGLRFFTQTLPANQRALRESEAEVFLKRGIGWQAGLMVKMCRRAGKRSVFWSASSTDPLCADRQRSRIQPHERRLAAYGLRHADAVIVQTEEQRQSVQERFGREAHVIPNLWPLSDTPPTEPAGPPEIFWAARVIPLKRPHLVLDLAERMPHLRFMMAAACDEGAEALHREVSARASSLPNVEFLGFVPFTEIDRYYARASAYLCTSTIEGFPNTFLQSWSHGRPVVTTYDPDDTVARHELGFRCNSTEELAEALDTVCRDGSAYPTRTRAYLTEHHSPEALLPEVERILLGA